MKLKGSNGVDSEATSGQSIKTNAPRAAKSRSAGKRGTKFAMKSSIYDFSDIIAASERAYDAGMDESEVRTRRRRDWLALIIGIPAFIGVIYFIVWLSQRG